jgi:hypothetical protein
VLPRQCVPAELPAFVACELAVLAAVPHIGAIELRPNDLARAPPRDGLMTFRKSRIADRLRWRAASYPTYVEERAI